MESNIINFVVKYNSILSKLRDAYRNQCSEISIKVCALNLACVPDEVNLDEFKNKIDEISLLYDLESRLIALSLFYPILESEENKSDYIREIYARLSDHSSKGVYCLICSFLVYCSNKSYKEIESNFNSLSQTLAKNHPVTNAFEYSPFVLLASLLDITDDEIEKKSRSLYYSLHDSAFARGTNSYCTSLYLSTIPYNVDTDYIRKIYTSLKSRIPCNQFNYLDCAQIYVYNNNFSDFDTIVEIFNKISGTGGPKWFSDQLDVSITIGIYLCALKANSLPGLSLNLYGMFSANLLASMIASTLLLNFSA